MSGISLQIVEAELDRLPALPEVVQRVIAYLQNDEVDIGRAAEMIVRDPGLTARLLRVANSSFYGLQGRVATVNDALIVLGLRTVRTVVTAAALTGHLRNMFGSGDEQRAFWLHCAGTAVCARVLARKRGADAENAFTAGLLHDIGQLILAARFPDDYQRVLAYRVEQDCYPIESEREVLGFDHTQIGAALAARWKFPRGIAEAIAWHHEPADRPDESLAGVIHVADVMAHVLDFPGDEDDLVPRLSSSSWSRLGIGWSEFKGLLAEVDAQRDDVAQVLN